jgi:hypothetical protein
MTSPARTQCTKAAAGRVLLGGRCHCAGPPAENLGLRPSSGGPGLPLGLSVARVPYGCNRKPRMVVSQSLDMATQRELEISNNRRVDDGMERAGRRDDHRTMRIHHRRIPTPTTASSNAVTLFSNVILGIAVYRERISASGRGHATSAVVSIAVAIVGVVLLGSAEAATIVEPESAGADPSSAPTA